jgi:hypothetical protein
MPTGPKGEKRRARRVIGNAVHIIRIATGAASGKADFELSTRLRDTRRDPALRSKCQPIGLFSTLKRHLMQTY